jgi:hypothetical protein
MEIQHGTLLTCETASGGHVTMRALGPVMQGIDFPVVWVCLPEDYQADEDARGLAHRDSLAAHLGAGDRGRRGLRGNGLLVKQR